MYPAHHTASDGLGYTLHVHTAGGGKGIPCTSILVVVIVKNTTCSFKLLVVESGTPTCTSILVVMERNTPCMHVHTGGGGKGYLHPACTSILLATEMYTLCTCIMLAKERNTLWTPYFWWWCWWKDYPVHVLIAGSGKGYTLHQCTSVILSVWCWKIINKYRNAGSQLPQSGIGIPASGSVQCWNFLTIYGG